MDSKFEHALLEQEIKELAKEIKERGLTDKGKEGIHAVIQEKLAPLGGTPSAAQPVPPAAASRSLPGYLDKESPEVKLKVEKLLDMALHKGIKASVDEARNNNPLVIDAFHDALTDRLYGELKSRGLLE